jgi:hypothetical protein
MKRGTILAAALVAFGVSSACAQQTPPLEVGAIAPDFALPGSTRYGLLRAPVRLSDFRGKTVILAFYYRSRTRG